MEAAAETINAGSVPRAAFWLRALSDKSLVKLIAAGSDEAFTVIYQRYQGPLFAYCVSMLQDYTEAEDALHEVMIRTHSTLGGSDRDIEIKPWLYRCARNHCLNVIERRTVRDGAMHELVAEHETVDSKVELKEEVKQVLSDVSHLPDEQRQALLMREAAGMSHASIADALDVDASKAKRLLFEARRSLHAGVEGRSMECAEVRFEMSQGDGRTGRRRELRSHMRSCEACREFKGSMKKRKAVLAGGLPLLAPGSALAGLAKIFGSASVAEASTVAAGAGAAGSASVGATGIAAKLAGTGLVAQKGVAIVAAGGIIAGGGYAVTEEVQNVVKPDKAAVSAVTPGEAKNTEGAAYDTMDRPVKYGDTTSSAATPSLEQGGRDSEPAAYTGADAFDDDSIGENPRRAGNRKVRSRKRSGRSSSRKGSGKKRSGSKKPVKKLPGETQKPPEESTPPPQPPQQGEEPPTQEPPPATKDPPPRDGTNPDCQHDPHQCQDGGSGGQGSSPQGDGSDPH